MPGEGRRALHHDSYSFGIETATKFFHDVRVSGWFHHPVDELEGVALIGAPSAGSLAVVEDAGDGVHQRFSVQTLLCEEGLSAELSILLRARSGWVEAVPLADLIAEREAAQPLYPMWDRFRQAVVDLPSATVLEIGGRDRSGTGHRRLFGPHPSVVFDIVPAPGVDVVGDAHQLDRHFPPGAFEAFVAVSVFEHLLMPWVVVLQLNRALREGGLGYVSTHQALAIHDMPWDFWRFSDTAWDALFNRQTGFEIVERVMDHEQYVLPFLCRPGKEDTERAVGYEASAVTVRKIGPTSLSWPVRVEDILATAYPTS